MPDPTVRARPFTYTAAGMPIMRRVYSVACLDAVPEFLGARHITYTDPAGLPIKAWAWECCDAFCTDEEEANETCRVRTDCQTGGLPRRLMAYLTDVHSCFSARNKRTILEYQDSDPMDPLYETWYGEVELRGGTLEIIFNCESGPSYNLNIGGCQADASVGAVTVGCTDPLLVTFGPIQLDDCCDCHKEGTPNPLARDSDTDETAEINIVVVGDCRKTAFARAVTYLADGTPVVAIDKPCAWNAPDETQECGDMVCGILAGIDNVSGCECLEMTDGTIWLNYRVGQWVDESGGWGCPGGVQTVTVTCTDLENGQLRIGVTIVCGVTAGGFGFTDIDPADLEDLDANVTVGIDNSSDPSECCSGTVTVRVYRAPPPP